MSISPDLLKNLNLTLAIANSIFISVYFLLSSISVYNIITGQTWGSNQEFYTSSLFGILLVVLTTLLPLLLSIFGWVKFKKSLLKSSIIFFIASISIVTLMVGTIVLIF